MQKEYYYYREEEEEERKKGRRGRPQKSVPKNDFERRRRKRLWRLLAARKNVFLVFVLFLSFFARDVVLLRSFRILPGHVWRELGDMCLNARERDEELEKKKKKKKKKEKKKKMTSTLCRNAQGFPARVLPRRRRPAWKHGGSNAYNLDLSKLRGYRR